MSMTLGLIAIKGSCLTKTALIFQIFKLIETGNTDTLDSWDKVEPIIEKEYMDATEDGTQKRICWEDNGWTMIEDFSLLLCTDEAGLRKLSRKLRAPIFSMATQGTSGSYGFWFFNCDKERIFFASNGEITQNDGNPLESEKEFNIDEEVAYDDILGLSKSIGIDWERRVKKHSFYVKTLEDSPELKKELEEFQRKQKAVKSQNREKKKSWLRFW